MFIIVFFKSIYYNVYNEVSVMGSGIYFPTCAILFSVLTLILFFGKKHISTVETKIYGFLLRHFTKFSR